MDTFSSRFVNTNAVIEVVWHIELLSLFSWVTPFADVLQFSVLMYPSVCLTSVCKSMITKWLLLRFSCCCFYAVRATENHCQSDWLMKHQIQWWTLPIALFAMVLPSILQVTCLLIFLGFFACYWEGETLTRFVSHTENNLCYWATSWWPGPALFRGARIFTLCHRICCLPQKNTELPVFCCIYV